MKTRDLIISVILLFTTTISFAQEKVVEKSGKKPDWIGQTISEAIIVSSNNNDLMEAQDQCMEEVKKEIVNSIAVNITTSSSNSIEQVMYNDSHSSFSKYTSKIEETAAKIPYINGISITDAETYWEKIYVKKEKRYYYRYYLKYPYPNSLRLKLVNEFRKIDNQKQEKLNELKKAYENISAVEDIKKCLIELQTLKEYFFDSTRLSETSELEKKFKELYKQISVQTIENIPGKYTFTLMLKNRTVSLSSTPRLTSEYATNMSISQDNTNNTFVVKYDYTGCTDEDENSIKVIINLGHGTISHKFRFDLSESEPEISIPGFVNIKVAENPSEIKKEDTEDAEDKNNKESESMEEVSYICTVEINIMTNSKDLKIEKIMLNIGETTESLVCEEFDDSNIIPGNNIYTCKVKGIKSFGEKHKTLTDGYIDIKNKTDNNVKRIRIQRPYKVIR